MKASLVWLVSATLAARAITAHADGTIQFLTEGLKPYPGVSKAMSNDLVLEGSRGEILNFAFQTSLPKCTSFKLKGIKGPVSFYSMLPFVTQHPSFEGAPVGTHYDPLLPATKICAPDAASARASWVMGEYQIPDTLPPGKYEGTLSDESGSSAKVSLTVWRMTMPKEPVLPLYANLITWFLTLGHHGKWAPGEAHLGKIYAESLARHRIYPMSNWVREADFKDGVVDLKTIDGAKTEDSYFASAVMNTPGSALITVPGAHKDWTEENKIKYFTSLQKVLVKEKLIDRAFIYAWDEPGPTEQADLIHLLQLIRKNAPKLKILVTTPYRPELEGLIDIFVPVMDQYDVADFAKPDAYQALRKKGHQLWMYISCMSHGCDNAVSSGTADWVIDRPSVYIRAMGWLGEHYKIDSFLYYSVDNSFQFTDRDHWKDLWDFTGNGDGTLYYPGKQGTYGLDKDAAIESVRLKLWRQTSYDAQYISWIEKAAPAWWPTQFASLVKDARHWSKNEADYIGLRHRIGEYLSGR